ncbi:hypothetical protein Kvar_1636 [Klebsiella variicola At-22]|nr:hypothetical protein Kvar_1636 [Klebsiella variicola At-22]CAI0735191.1 Uncharacterised protein [Serratia ficaria]CAI1601499.1 Uncharacterised protein [Serratia ficaria]
MKYEPSQFEEPTQVKLCRLFDLIFLIGESLTESTFVHQITIHFRSSFSRR